MLVKDLCTRHSSVLQYTDVCKRICQLLTFCLERLLLRPGRCGSMNLHWLNIICKTQIHVVLSQFCNGLKDGNCYII